MNVLVIPEDFRKDQYVLKPIIKAMMKEAGAPRAVVRVCQDPLLGGIDQALRWERIGQILAMNPMVDLFLLCVDRDGVEGRRRTLNMLEDQAKRVLGGNRVFLAENAHQEIEVWLLAGQKLLRGWRWQAVRREIHPKEKYFLPLALQRGLLDEPAEGRATLAEQAAKQYARVHSLCDEVADLEQRIRSWIGGGT